jgi:hypothetical protein
MLNFESTLDQLAGLTLLRYFPADAGARLELAKLVARMASNEQQVDWLVQRTLALCGEWPGPLGLRQIFCSKFKPADGIEAGGTTMFPDGPPSEKKIEASPLPALPPGSGSIDRQLDSAVKLLARSKDLNRTMAPRVPKDPISPERRAEIQAQIDAAILERRDKRARAELGEVAE